jgi:hypothetical protein
MALFLFLLKKKSVQLDTYIQRRSKNVEVDDEVPGSSGVVHSIVENCFNVLSSLGVSFSLSLSLS